MSATLKPYSVLLLYPDYMNDDGVSTYYAHVEEKGAAYAVRAARKMAAEANDAAEGDDFALLSVIAGHHELELGSGEA